ncbi:LIC_10190 family membrane protein [Flavobacterium sp. RSB2_4_14]|uniref:LIC_10190 family membrane protein n=1 Tax=Flavobacterium sp. RSB2_4_14 TaxID=3447665 RepID=UPI003F2A75C1
MVLIFICWLYLFLTSIVFGIGFPKWFRIPSFDIVISSILGLFSITVLASFWALFGSINIAFHLFLFLFSVVLLILNKEQFLTIIKKTKVLLVSFPMVMKLLLIISSLLVLAQSATLPFIIDNETYYIQTIKWLNEYGFVPGLANLHLFFGQTSGWHITQSVYSFSFLYERFNDLNGYCLLIGNFWAFGKLHSYFETKSRMDLAFGLLPLTFVFLFQFANAPSPDLPIYIFGLILFSLYIDKENFTLITAIALFLVYIKITAVVLLLLPALLLFKNYAAIKNKLIGSIFLGVLIFSLFIIKNGILTGYPFFPMTFISLHDVNYVVPKEVVDFFFSRSMMHSFYMPFGAFEDSSLLYLLKHYFLQNGLDSIIAIVTVFLLLFSPIVIKKQYHNKSLWTIYLTFIILIFLLIFSSPQYRFYLYFTIFFGLLWLSWLLTNKKIIMILFSFSFLLVAVLIFIPISFSRITNNKSLASNSTFHLKNVLIPEPNTKGNEKFILLPKDDLDFYSPIDYPFFWVTGNGNLPCVNAEQLNYFETHFHVIPEQRGASLGDGFYAKKVNSND